MSPRGCLESNLPDHQPDYVLLKNTHYLDINIQWEVIKKKWKDHKCNKELLRKYTRSRVAYYMMEDVMEDVMKDVMSTVLNTEFPHQ